MYNLDAKSKNNAFRLKFKNPNEVYLTKGSREVAVNSSNIFVSLLENFIKFKNTKNSLFLYIKQPNKITNKKIIVYMINFFIESIKNIK